MLEAHIDPFNPVVEDWTTEAQEAEEQAKKESDFRLYVITPNMEGVFSICEATDDSNKTPETTIFVVLPEYKDNKFYKGQLKSLIATAKVIRDNGAQVFSSLESTATFLNNIS